MDGNKQKGKITMRAYRLPSKNENFGQNNSLNQISKLHFSLQSIFLFVYSTDSKFYSHPNYLGFLT